MSGQRLLGLQAPAENSQGLAPYGLRHDGSGAKAKGFFGPVPAADGVSTEISVGMDINGRPMEVPSMVPTLDPSEMHSLLRGERPSEEVYRKALAHALKRIDSGMSPFAGSQELYVTPGMLGEMYR